MSKSPVETSDLSTVASQEAIGEKTPAAVVTTKDEHGLGDDDPDSDPNAIIITGADAALHLLSLRDDFDRVLTFRSIMLASGLACFQAVMNQIYQVLPIHLFPIEILTTRSIVQTDLDYDSRNLHRAHLLLCRQCLGKISSPWRQIRSSLEGEKWPGGPSLVDQGHKVHQPRAVESERTCNLFNHCYVGLKCCDYLNRVCSTGSFLQPSPKPRDCDIEYHLYWSIRLRDLRNFASYRCLAHRGCLLE